MGQTQLGQGRRARSHGNPREALSRKKFPEAVDNELALEKSEKKFDSRLATSWADLLLFLGQFSSRFSMTRSNRFRAMSPVLRRPSISRFAGVLIALLVAAGIAPRSAVAGCQAPHVFSLSGEKRDAVLNTLAIFADSSAERATANVLKSETPVPPSRKLPCSGPTCSNRPTQPDKTFPPSTETTELFCSTAISAPTINPPDPSDRLGSFGLPRPSHVSFGLERPPR